ncbi:MAG: hypothetical protein KDD44_06740, partial [Bdellovibrionales bacterium]|nr:hypothetical protein [Bdellovibrionales bacterium]
MASKFHLPQSGRGLALAISALVFAVIFLFSTFFPHAVASVIGFSLQPVRATTTLYLLLIGCAALAGSYRHHLLAQHFALVVSICTFLSILQYIPGLEFGVDLQLFFSDTAIAPAHFARSSINAALSFFSLSVGLVFLLQPIVRRWRLSSLFAGFFFVISFIVAFVSAFGSAIGLEPEPRWLSITGMPLSVSLVMIVLAAFALGWSWQRFQSQSLTLRELWLSIIAFSALGVFSITTVASSMGVLPFYETLLSQASSEVRMELQQRAHAMDAYLTGIRAVSSSAAVVGPLDTDPGLLEEEFRRIIRYSRDFSGIARIAADNSIISQAGVSLGDLHDANSFFQTLRKYRFGAPIELGGE